MILIKILKNKTQTRNKKPHSLLVIDATLTSDNFSTFQKESFRKNIKNSHDK